MPRSAACGYGCCSTTMASPGSTRDSLRSTATRTSRCGCSIRLRIAASRRLDYFTDFSRLNRRMHNKSFTADTQATIVGGRNIGDEYFAASDAMVFADLDVLALGSAARDVGAAFDLYWNSDAAYPIDLMVARADPSQIADMHAKFAEIRASQDAIVYMNALQSTKLVTAVLANELPLEWAQTRLVTDSPNKVQGTVSDDELMLTRLLEVIGKPQRQFDLVSPYFVPGKEGTKALSSLPERGVPLRVLTNSLAEPTWVQYTQVMRSDASRCCAAA